MSDYVDYETKTVNWKTIPNYNSYRDLNNVNENKLIVAISVTVT